MNSTLTPNSEASTVPYPCYHALSAPFSAKDFFHDTPWLNVPPHRRGEILIEPLYPSAGLLGGSSSSGAGKVSKLAALAAKRKQRDAEKKAAAGKENVNNSAQSSPSLALLGRLGARKDLASQHQQGRGTAPERQSRSAVKERRPT